MPATLLPGSDVTDPKPGLKGLDGGVVTAKNRGRRGQTFGKGPMLQLVNATTEDTIDVDAVHRGLAALLMGARTRKGQGL